MQRRIAGIQKVIVDRGLDGMLSTRYEYIGYLTGVFHRSGVAMLVEPEGKPIIVCDEPAIIKSEAWAPDLLQIEHADSRGLPIARIAALAHAVEQRGLAGKRLGLEKAHLTALEMELLASLLPDAEWVEAGNVIPLAMLVKGNDEVGALRRAAEIADAGMKRALDTLRVGVTELEVAGEMELVMNRLGADRTWFPIHVASGYRSDLAIAYATEKLIQPNDKVALDIGPIYHLYCGELCTQVIVGKASADIKRLYQSMVDVHSKVVETLIPGKRASEVFNAGYEYSQNLGVKEVYPSFGRSIGVTGIDESLFFRSTCETVLAPGMVVATVTYVGDGRHAIGAERMVLITEDSPEILSTLPLDLVEI